MAQEFRQILKYADQPGYTPDMECYLRHGGYEALKKALAITPKSLPDIGRRFGGRDHTTVIHAVRQIEKLRASDAELDADIRLLTRQLEG